METNRGKRSISLSSLIIQFSSGPVQDDHSTEPAVHPDISLLCCGEETPLGEVGLDDKGESSIPAWQISMWQSGNRHLMSGISF